MELFLVSLFVFGSILHCYTDFKERLLYDEVSLIMMVAGLFYVSYKVNLGAGVLGAAVTGGVFFLIFGFCQGGMGFGDVKLAAVLGSWLGWQQGLLALLLSLCLGSIVGATLMLFYKKDCRYELPFGPYMCLSGMIMLAKGQAILSWYESFF